MDIDGIVGIENIGFYQLQNGDVGIEIMITTVSGQGQSFHRKMDEHNAIKDRLQAHIIKAIQQYNDQRTKEYLAKIRTK